MSKVINLAYEGAMEFAVTDYSTATVISSDFQRLKDEVQIIEKQLNNPRVYKGGWKFRMNRRHK